MVQQETTHERLCGKTVYRWDGEYENECIRPIDHLGDHYDDLGCWFNDDGEPTEADHADDETPEDLT